MVGCAGSAQMANRVVPQQTSSDVTVRITIPKKNATARGAQYVSPATTQMTIDIEQGGVPISGYPQTIGLTPTSTGCTSTLANTLCQLSLALAPGAYTATISLLDASGNALSSAQSVPFTVVAGTNNTIPIVLGGIPHAIDLTPVNAPNSIGPSGLSVLGMQSIPIAAYTTDADDNIIVGPGAPTMTASVSSVGSGSGIGVTSPSSTTPNTLAISSTGYGTATLTVVATPSIGSAIQSQIPVTAGYYLTTLAGGTMCGFADGSGLSARFGCGGSRAIGITYDSGDGNFYAADDGNCAIRQVTAAGVVTTIAGGPANCGFADGTGTAAKFYSVKAITYDTGNGNLYVADNCAIRQVTISGLVTTIAGGGPSACGFADGTGSAAKFSDSYGIVYDSANGDLYVADSTNCAIRQVTTSGVVTTIAGAGPSTGCSFADGTGIAARFNFPEDIAFDANNGDLYVADRVNFVVRQVTTAGVVTTIAGSPGISGISAGDGSSARFSDPSGLAYDASNGDLYVADGSPCAIQQVSTAGVVSVILTDEYTGTCAANAGFDGSTNPFHLSFDQSNGLLYVTGDSVVMLLQF